MLPTGKGEEQALAGTVLTLLCLQMGSGPEGEEVFRSLKPLLISVLTDSTASPSARQSVRPGLFPPGDTSVVGRAQAMPLGAPVIPGGVTGLWSVVGQSRGTPTQLLLGWVLDQAQHDPARLNLTAFPSLLLPVCHGPGYVLLHCCC